MKRKNVIFQFKQQSLSAASFAHTLSDTLRLHDIKVTSVGDIDAAIGLECVSGNNKFGLLLSEFNAADRQWLLEIDSMQGVLTRWFRGNDSEDHKSLLTTIDGALKDNPGIDHIRWLNNEELQKGGFDFSPTPF